MSFGKSGMETSGFIAIVVEDQRESIVYNPTLWISSNSREGENKEGTNEGRKRAFASVFFCSDLIPPFEH